MNSNRQNWIDRFIRLGIFACSFLALAIGARSKGPSAGELVHWNAARSIGEWLDRVAHGTAKFGDHFSRDAVFGALPNHGDLQTWISGLSWQSGFRRHPVFSELFAFRFGHVLLSSLSLPLVYLLMRNAYGRRIALLSVGFLLLSPRLIHELSLAGGQGPALTAWLLVLSAFVGWQRIPSVWRMLWCALSFGLGLAITPSVFYLLPVLLVVSQWSKRSEFRSALAAGRLPVPAPILLMPVLGAAVWLGLKPWLWHQTGDRIRLVFSDWISPVISPSLYQTQWISSLPVPKWQAVLTASLSVPSLTMAFALVGLVCFVYRAWIGPFDSRSRVVVLPNTLQLTRTSTMLGLLLLAMLATIWPSITPDVLTLYPARWLLAMPVVACGAGIGLDFALRILDKLFAWRLNFWRQISVAAYVVCIFGSLSYQAFRSPSTQVAAFPVLLGGAKAVARSGLVSVHDGSIAKGLAPAIDALGSATLTIYSPDVPSDVWEGLRQRGMLRTSIRSVPSAKDADLIAVGSDPAAQSVLHAVWVKRGTAPAALARIERDGCVILGLYQAQLR